MKTIRHLYSAMLVPEIPDGYRPPSTFAYSSLLLAILSTVAFVVSAVAFGFLLWYFHGRPDEISFTIGSDFSFLLSGVGISVGMVVFFLAGIVVFVGTLVLHEAIHGLVFRRLGYRVSYGFAPKIPALYTAAFDQFVARRDNMLVGVAPLVVITLVAVPLLAGPIPIALVAYFVLLVNTSGAVGDCYLLWRLWQMPPGTVLYDADIDHSYVFEPASDTAIRVGKLTNNR